MEVAKFLRAEIGTTELLKQSRNICRPAGYGNFNSSKESGFPVLVDGQAEPIIDAVLDEHAAGALWVHLAETRSNTPPRRERCRQELIRTVMLLRSNLDENDLLLPRRGAARPHALAKLVGVTAAAFVIATAATILTWNFAGPLFFVVLWAGCGVFILWRKPGLIEKAVEDDPASHPFLTQAQCREYSTLVSAEERAAFSLNFLARERPECRSSRRTPRWRILLYPLAAAIYTVTGVVAVVFFAAVIFIMWPFAIRDAIENARRPNDR